MSRGDRPLYLAAMGDVTNVVTWSGIPFHFHEAGARAGFFDGPVNLPTNRIRVRRVLWNLSQVLTGQRRGGYQYSRSCLAYLFGCVEGQLRESEVISHFQLFPPADRARAAATPFSHYIDMPLTRLFDEYRIGETIGRRIAADALRREAENYAAARFVVCMSSWAAKSVVAECGVDRSRVKVILPGANVSETAVEIRTADLDASPIVSSFTAARPFRLGFTGRDPYRKGLPRLIKAAAILKDRGYPVEVSIIGICPEEFRNEPVVREIGMIQKRTEMDRFIDTVMSMDLGCLLSDAEGLGISTLEFLRVGVPVMGTEVGGITDCIPKRAGLLLPERPDPEDVAAKVQELLDNPVKYEAMRKEARAIRRHYSWDRTVKEFALLWSNKEASTRFESGRSS